MTRLFVSRALPGPALVRLGPQFSVSVWPEPEPPSAEELRRNADGADALITMLPDKLDANLFDAAPGLRLVSNMAVGFDNVDIEAATRRGILVTNTPEVLTETVADLTLGLVLASARRLFEADKSVRSGSWGTWKPDYLLGRNLGGATLGIVGLGEIGKAVAGRAASFGMDVIYASRAAKEDVERALGVKRVQLMDLMRSADFVSLHVSLSQQTRGLIGRAELAVMGREAVLINTSRGPIVDEAALIEALQAKRIGGAALDVFTEEPLPVDSPLLGLPNVIVTPHIGSATLQTRSRMADLCVSNVLAYFAGERPPTPVNPEVLAAQ